MTPRKNKPKNSPDKSASVVKKAEKRGAGRPKLELDEAFIVERARVGTSTRDIAALLGCDEGVLRRGEWFKIINKARAERRAALHKMQWDLAKNNPTLLIWLGKNELGQTDKQEHEIEASMKVEVVYRDGVTGG